MLAFNIIPSTGITPVVKKTWGGPTSVTYVPLTKGPLFAPAFPQLQSTLADGTTRSKSPAKNPFDGLETNESLPPAKSVSDRPRKLVKRSGRCTESDETEMGEQSTPARKRLKEHKKKAGRAGKKPTTEKHATDKVGTETTCNETRESPEKTVRAKEVDSSMDMDIDADALPIAQMAEPMSIEELEEVLDNQDRGSVMRSKEPIPSAEDNSHPLDHNEQPRNNRRQKASDKIVQDEEQQNSVVANAAGMGEENLPEENPLKSDAGLVDSGDAQPDVPIEDEGTEEVSDRYPNTAYLSRRLCLGPLA